MMEKMSLPELARELDLPVWIVRRVCDRFGLLPTRRYKGQRRLIPADALPAIRQALAERGYPAKA